MCMDFFEVSAACVENMQEGEKMVVFDWDKAAELIIEHDMCNAEAFIQGEEDTTSGVILLDKHLVGDHGAVLESYRGLPVLRDMDTRREFHCYRERPVTNWTASAVMRLIGGGELGRVSEEH